MKMKKFDVTITYSVTARVTVNAEDEYEAKDIAESNFWVKAVAPEKMTDDRVVDWEIDGYPGVEGSMVNESEY